MIEDKTTSQVLVPYEESIQIQNFDNLPLELQRQVRTWCLWRSIMDISRPGKEYKTPFDPEGKGRGNNDPALHRTFDDAQRLLELHPQARLAVYQPAGGIHISANGHEGYLYIFDLDGYVCGNEWLGDTLWEMLGFTYAERSPSGTGAKLLMISDLPPQKKRVFKLPPNQFFEAHPHIAKYGSSHAVEVFSRDFYNCITGDVWDSGRTDLAFIPAVQLQHVFDHLDCLNPDTKMPSLKTSHTVLPNAGTSQIGRLTEQSLTQVLSRIDHHPEGNWSDVANALARSYGEAGRQYYLRWSHDGYGQQQYPDYDHANCSSRYDRALHETANRPGYGCRHLCELAGVALAECKWQDTKVDMQYQNFIDGFRRLFPDWEWASQMETARSVTQRFTFRTPKELSSLPLLAWRVKKVLPKTGLAAIFGASGSGKSFLALDLLARISLGLEFYEHKSSPCPVVYACLEGGGGISNRIAAWQKHHDCKLPETFRVTTDQLSLFNQDAKLFAEAVKDARLDAGVIVIDTLNQSAPTADENTSTDMGRIVQNAMTLQRITDSLVILVHHSGKDRTKGLRGHSSLLAALDVAIEVRRTKEGRDWVLAKAKDADDMVSHNFRLNPVGLGTDTDGEPVNSCVALPDVMGKFRRPPPSGKNQVAALAALKTHVATSKDLAIDIATAIDRVKAALDSDPKRRATRAKEAIDGLVAGGYLSLDEDTISLS